MKRVNINIVICIFLSLLLFPTLTYSGNEQRAGQAGASELLINPWSRSSGWGSCNSSSVRGLEATFSNVAGTAFIKKTELIFSRVTWLKGTDIFINSFGLSQALGESGVLSLSVMSMDFGKIEITTVDLPEGGLGTFHPNYTNIALSFAKEFSNSIYGGATIKIINEKISDLSANGVALDAGIQYITGLGTNKLGKKNRDNLKFGISLKNWGPTMKYRGDGMSIRATTQSGVIMTAENRSADFELPSLINIGISYDIKLFQKVDTINNKITSDHRISLALNYTSNSFTKDQFGFGLEYGLKNFLMIRGGYVYEKGIESYDTRTTVFTGPTAGVTLQIPLGKESGSTFSIDYSYRATNPFDGTHSIGAKITL